MSENNQTEGVSTLLGDPKKAILKLSGPMIIAMLMSSLYNLIDSIWVAGLGEGALAAIGFITPLFLIGMGFSNGLGAGATSAISRSIGEKNKKDADNTALHVLLLTVIFTIIITVVLVVFLEPILRFLGAGNTIDLALTYGQIVFGGSIFLVFSSAAYGILRGEGDVKKPTYAMILSAIINMILDPIMIYVFGWGIAGAAIATIISMMVVCALLLYWFTKDTYIDFSFENFRYSNKIVKRIMDITLPTGMDFFLMGALTGVLNVILVMVSGTDGVAVYSAGWRVVMIAFVPIIAVELGAIPVVGASFGAKKIGNLKAAVNYSVKLNFLVAIITTLATFLLAPYIAEIFTYSPETMGLGPLITYFLQIMSLFYLFLPLGFYASALFQGIGKGIHTLFLTFVREFLLTIVFSYILAIVLGWDIDGVWWGIVIGNTVGSIIAYIWANEYIKKLVKLYGESTFQEKDMSKN